jgi:hypothetical protein
MNFKQILHHLNRRDKRIFPKNLTAVKITLIILALFTLTFTVKTILADDTTLVSNPSITEVQENYLEVQEASKKGSNLESWDKSKIAGDLIIVDETLGGPLTEDVFKIENIDFSKDIDETIKGSSNLWQPGGLIGVTTNTISNLYNVPISGVEYIAQVKNNILGKPTYAQSAGFQKMSAIIPIWKGFRNATYILFSIIFVAMGIMLMLRVKISPQATITIQSVIPKIITSLILVTFSYAIVGILIDLSYLIEGLALSIILNSGTLNLSVKNLLTNPNMFSRITSMIPYGTLMIWNIIISSLVGLILTLMTAGAGAIFGIVIGLISFALITLAIFIFILWNLFKFFFGLLKCYVSVVIKTIIGPFEIALGAIPNMKIGFGTWFVDILANLLVFPISLVYLVLIKTIMAATWHQSFWAPPGIDTLNVLTGSWISGGILPVALGLVGIVTLAKLPALIPELVFQIKPNAFGKAIGEGFNFTAGIGKMAKGGAKYGVNAGGKYISDTYGNPDSLDPNPREQKARAVGKMTDFFTRH